MQGKVLYTVYKVQFTILLIVLLGLPTNAMSVVQRHTYDDGVEPVRTLTLEQAIELVLKQNRTLQQNLLNIDSASLALRNVESEFDIKVSPTGRIGRSSEEDEQWRVGAAVSKQTSTGVIASVIPEISSNDTEKKTNVAFSLKIPLLRGLGEKFTKNAIYSSAFSLAQAYFDFYKLQDSVVLQIVNAVYQSVQNQQNIIFLTKQLSLLKNHLALAKLKEKAGVISAIDLYRAEIRIKEVQEELTRNQEIYRNSLDQVKAIMALPMRGDINVSAPIDTVDFDGKEENLIEIALENRVEIKQKELERKEEKRKVAVAKNSLLPQLNLELGYNRFGDEIASDLSEESWAISLSSDTDLFRKNEENQFAISKINYRRSVINLEEAKEIIAQEVRSAINSLIKQKKQISIRKEKVKQAEGKLKLSESKFRHGMAGNFDLLESQTQLQHAQISLLNEKISYIIGMYTLRSKLGTLTLQEAANDGMQ